jgi:hypothetical protein
MLEDEKSWSEQVQEFEDEGNAFRASRDMTGTPPPKRNSALSNPFAPIAKKSTNMLTNCAPLEPRPDASKSIRSDISEQLPSPEETNNFVSVLKAIRDKLATQHTSGQPLTVRNEVLIDIDNQPSCGTP